MVPISRMTVLLVATISFATAVQAQEWSGAERAYRSVVASFFGLPEAEIAILGNWDLPADEIPVVLFVARRSGVSAEALVALRESGWSWPELAQRYRVGPQALHVPLQNQASAGALAPVYQRFSQMPVTDWPDIRLSSEDIVALVNVRVLSQALGLTPDEIMRRTGSAGSFVDLYGQLVR